MKLNTAVKTLMLIIPLLPIVWVLLIYPFVESDTLAIGTQLLVLAIVSLIIFILYLTHLWKNNEVHKNSKINWIFLFVLFGSVAQLIYWFKYVKISS